MQQLAELVATAHETWVSRVVEAVLGTTDPEHVATTLAAAVEGAMGEPVIGARFYESGVGIVAGLELADGRAVVAKVHRSTLVTSAHLEAVARAQTAAFDAGLPAPAPLTGPTPLGDGWLMIEALLEGDRADGSEPTVRRSIAAALHAFVAVGRPLATTPGLDPWIGPPVVADLWPEPHDLRFDFPGTEAGAEWIDDVARAAREVLSASRLPPVVGHLDWRVQNLGFAGSTVSAIYDWDSLALVPEPALVGATSVTHPVDWRLPHADPFPTVDQAEAFVVDYEDARGATFDGHEREVLDAAQRWIASYGARCQHSDAVLGLFPGAAGVTGWARVLRDLLAR